MDKKEYYKYLLIVGAMWNLVLAIPMLIMSFLGASGFTGASLMYYQGFFIAVIIFGCGYLTVGLNLDENHGLIFFGVIGKILVFIFFLVYAVQGHIPFYMVLAGVGDLVFAVFFIEFLLNYKKL